MLFTWISDFGFAISTIKNRLLETFCGSYAYCCPQILRGEPYDGKKADVWSMGVVLYAMACARLPFSDEDMRALAKEGYQGKVKFSKRVSKGTWINWAVADPDLEISVGQTQKTFFRPFGPQFGLKIRGVRAPRPLPWIRHWKVRIVWNKGK